MGALPPGLCVSKPLGPFNGGLRSSGMIHVLLRYLSALASKSGDCGEMNVSNVYTLFKVRIATIVGRCLLQSLSVWDA